jgi:hypothetical protein
MGSVAYFLNLRSMIGPRMWNFTQFPSTKITILAMGTTKHDRCPRGHGETRALRRSDPLPVLAAGFRRTAGAVRTGRCQNDTRQRGVVLTKHVGTKSAEVGNCMSADTRTTSIARASSHRPTLWASELLNGKRRPSYRILTDGLI